MHHFVLMATSECYHGKEIRLVTKIYIDDVCVAEVPHSEARRRAKEIIDEIDQSYGYSTRNWLREQARRRRSAARKESRLNSLPDQK
jgi:hypothetical protein